MDKKKVQEAIGRVDQAVAQLSMNRESHVVLVNDMKLIETCCIEYFNEMDRQIAGPEEMKDGGTNIIPINPEPGNEDQQGSGDSV